MSPHSITRWSLAKNLYERWGSPPGCPTRSRQWISRSIYSRTTLLNCCNYCGIKNFDYEAATIFRPLLELQPQHPRVNVIKEFATQLNINRLQTPQPTMHATSTSRQDPVSPTGIPMMIIRSYASSNSQMCPDSNFVARCCWEEERDSQRILDVDYLKDAIQRLEKFM